METTNSEKEFSIKAIIEVPHDDVDITELLDLLKSLFLAYGYAPETVNKFFERLK